MSGGKNTVHFDIDMSAVRSMLDQLGSDIGTATRPAAQAAAQVFYDAVRSNVDRIGVVSGNLRRAVYQAFSPENSGPMNSEYHVSWNARKAPHGHLIEFGHVARYQAYVGKDGKWHTAIRPEMRGKKKPGRKASLAERDAYYVLRKKGPLQVAAQPFLRPALAKRNEAIAAAKKTLLDRLGGK